MLSRGLGSCNPIDEVKELEKKNKVADNMLNFIILIVTVMEL